MAVVKGDAYGMGALAVSRCLQDWGVPSFAVDSVAEGVELRAGGVDRPVLVLDGDVPDNAGHAVHHNLMPAVAHEEQLRAYELAAHDQPKAHPVWLIANVGFNRWGYRDLERFCTFARLAGECRHLEVRGFYAHLTNSNFDPATTGSQVEEFRQVASRAKEIFGPRLEISLLASHGIVGWGRTVAGDWVRPGILLYGEHAFLSPALDDPEIQSALQAFRPAIRLRARVLQLLDFGREEGVGYGQHHRAGAGRRLATVLAGFGGGYPVTGRNLHALVRGRRVPVVGDVGMDTLQIDVTSVPDLAVGDWVTLIGPDGGETYNVGDLARAAGLTSYQLLRQLHFQRVYVDSERTAS
jgi:alanine racemase